MLEEKEARTKEVSRIKDIPVQFYTVALLAKTGRPYHILVKADSAIDALVFAEKTEMAPVMGVHMTEFAKYLDSTKAEIAETLENQEKKEEAEVVTEQKG